VNPTLKKQIIILNITVALLLAGCGRSSDNVEQTNGNNTTTPVTVILTQDTNVLKNLSLKMDKTTLNKDEHTTLQVMATYGDGTSKNVTQEVEWVTTPEDSVAVNGSILIAKKDNPTTLKAKVGNMFSNTVNLNITWVVGGHTLPPEPDSTLNDSTLLGIDSNHDGVRDDIERKVYTTYPKAIQRAVIMQASRAKQKMLADPGMLDNARVWEKKITKYIDCTRYLYMYKNQARISRKEASLISEWQFDTKERVKTYMDYNKALSGGVYSINKPKLDDCEFNIDIVLEMDK